MFKPKNQLEETVSEVENQSVGQIVPPKKESSAAEPVSNDSKEKPAKKKKAKAVSFMDTVNKTILNIISPQGVKFQKNAVDISDSRATLGNVVRLPTVAPVSWLSKISDSDGAVVSIAISPINSGSFIKTLSKNANQQRGEFVAAKDTLEQTRARNAAEHNTALIEEIENNGAKIAKMSITVAAISENMDEFTQKTANYNGKSDIYRQAENNVAKVSGDLRITSFRQKEALQQCLPTYPIIDEIHDIYGRIAPVKSIVGGFPWATSSYTDKKGNYFGKTLKGSVIMYDPWYRGGDRTNSNYVVLGKAGSGKSTAIKHIMINEYIDGTKQIIIDPESEYIKLAKKLKGDIITAGGDGRTRINPLQIRPAPKDEENEEDRLYRDEGNGLGDMALHIKNLEIFFNLYIPSLTDLQKAQLKICIIELYNKFDITWTTDITAKKPEDYPIFSDLYDLITEKLEKDKSDETLKTLQVLLYDIAKGADSFIWNGHTTLSSNSRFIVLDTHTLQGTSDNVKRAQYFNLLSWCWEQLSQDRSEHCMLYCDEAYLMIDPNVPQSLVFLRNVEKRARKYRAGIAIISHSAVDFLDPSIKMYGQALLDIPCVKIIMGIDGESFSEIQKLYHLTHAEEQLLLAQKQGTALVFFGGKRIGVHFDLSAHHYQLDLMEGIA